METKKLFYKECRLAGRMYHDASEVWGELRVGTRLKLVRDSSNRDDRDAVAVCYQREDAQTGECERFCLGYIPRDENRFIAQMLDMGWGEIFECRIATLRPEEHYEQQVRLIIRILRNPAMR